MDNMEDRWDRKNLVKEMEQARELATQLHFSLQAPSSSQETPESLIQQIRASFEKTLAIMTGNGGLADEISQSATGLARQMPDSPSLSETRPNDSDSDFNDQDQIASRKRKTLPRWSTRIQVSQGKGLEGIPDDGFSWRKYGQKDILGAKYPRAYYRCTNRNDQGCWATKQVQTSDEDPTMLEIIYRGKHTCTQGSYVVPHSVQEVTWPNIFQPSASTSTTTQEIQKFHAAIDEAMAMTKGNGGLVGNPPQPPIGLAKEMSDSPYFTPSEDFSDQDQIASSKRKTLPSWSTHIQVSQGKGVEGPPDDGHSWRKYGQKDILGSKYPRGYYRCNYRNIQGCLATKQVQRSDDDPTIFEITYQGTHTCTQGSDVVPPSVQEDMWSIRQPSASTSTISEAGFSVTEDSKIKAVQISKWNRIRILFKAIFGMRRKCRHQNVNLSKPPTSEGSSELIIPKTHEKSGQPSSSMDYGERIRPFVFQPLTTLSEEERPNKKLKMTQRESMQVNIQGRDENSNVPIAMEDLPLISHCFLFPFGHEFAKEELVRLWIAEGLFQRNQNQRDRVEDVANDKFDSLVSQQIIVPSRNDQTLDFRNPEIRKQMYKLNESKVSFLEHAACSEDKYVRVCDGKFNHLSENVLHLSVLCKNVDGRAFESIRRLKHLRTLLFIPDFGLSVERLPRNLFSLLKQLRALNFSRSQMSELPSSIGNLKALQYIDLSYTPIKQLPDSIDTLQSLQTLKLEECFNLIGLPNGTSKLTNLRHLVLDVIGQLKFMPPKMGNLTNLQTLSAFLVGRDDGRKIGELKNAINLTGSFCISRLENVSNREEAREANLINKKFLDTLELRWWNDKRVNSGEQEEILEYLQPPLGLKELRIQNYGGFKLPTWICDRSYECLLDLSLFNCSNCEVLPTMGELPLLQFLHIKEMNKLLTIDHQFCRDISDHNEQGHHSFPSLKTLIFEDMPELEEWTGIQSGDFPSLHKLEVKYCPKLKSIPSLSFFNSLKHLELSYCPSMLSFIESKEDVSLEFLLIKDCPELKKLCKQPNGRDWGKIAHVPNILIDDEEISCQ